MSNSSSPHPSPPLPLAGLRVVEFTHMVMGPTCGMVLADLGAEVIKVEPVDGDRTRHLLGAGAGFFPMFNRNKKSIALDLQTPEGREAVLRLVATADIVSENFKPGTMKKLGLDYATLSKLNIYVFVPCFVFHNVSTSTLAGPEMMAIVGLSVAQVLAMGLLTLAICLPLRVPPTHGDGTDSRQWNDPVTSPPGGRAPPYCSTRRMCLIGKRSS